MFNKLQTATTHSTRNLTLENTGSPCLGAANTAVLSASTAGGRLCAGGAPSTFWGDTPSTPLVSSHQEESAPHLSGRSDQGEGHQAQKQEQRLEIMEGLAMRTINGPRLLGCFPTERDSMASYIVAFWWPRYLQETLHCCFGKRSGNSRETGG